MRRLFAGPGSIASLAVKPLLTLAVLLAAFAVAPAAASAAPAHPGASITNAAAAGAGTTVTSAKPTTRGWTTAPAPVAAGSHNRLSDQAGTNAVFTCNYFARAPFYFVDFTCSVSSGAIQLFIDCSDGQRYFSPVLAAVRTYNLRGTCGPPAAVVNFGYVTIL
jgi:hypothetical protein